MIKITLAHGAPITVPDIYGFLQGPAASGHPKLLLAGLASFGLKEAPGAADNSEILQWAKDLDIASVYRHDDGPWCGLAMGHFVKQAGWPLDNFIPPEQCLWALSWVNWGKHVDLDKAGLGDVLCFKRQGGGHVGLYVGEDATYFHVLGGNQGDMVSIIRVAKDRLVGVRRPPYTVQPKEVKKIHLSPTGVVSVNEA